MATVITADRPDPRFYINIIQHGDGNWESQPMPVDDVTLELPNFFTNSINTVVTPGLRTIVQGQVNSLAKQIIDADAPAGLQSTNLYIISQGIAGDALDSAHALFTWINATNAFRDALNASIATMTFDELVVYTIPTEDSWPPLPSNMPV